MSGSTDCWLRHALVEFSTAFMFASQLTSLWKQKYGRVIDPCDMTERLLKVLF